MRKFLIVVDMQKDFVNGAGYTGGSCHRAAGCGENSKLSRRTLCHTGYPRNGLSSNGGGEEAAHPPLHSQYGGLAAGSERGGSAFWEKYTVVEKPTFGSTRLPALIAEAAHGEEFSLELIGLCTDICVVSNALLLKAHFPEVPMSVDASCCAGVSPQTHKAALATMQCCQIDVVESK